MDLRPYQLEARDRVLAELERVRATLLVLATGLGKTIVFASVAAAFVARGQRVLVLAHRGELLDQAAATLRGLGLSVGFEIAARRAGDEQVVLASVQSMRGERLAGFAVDAFGLVVLDEAHRAAATSYRAILEHFAGAKALGVTATPDRTDGVGLRNVFDSTAFRMELAEGVRAGWLAPIELRSVVVDSLDISRVRSVAGELHQGELEAELTRDRVLHEVAGPLAELAQGRQTLAFVAGVRQAHELAKVLAGYGVTAASVDGSMAPDARAAVLADYRAGRVQVVCNALLLVEGFDAPETSCVALVRPTRSRSLLAQQIGRGTRLAEGKSECLILDFIPERAGSIRLAAPADALAGTDLPDAVIERVRASSLGKAENLDTLIAKARAEEEAAKQRLVHAVDVAYVAARVDLLELLDLVAPAPANDAAPARTASAAQVEALRKAGFEAPYSLTAAQAAGLFDVLAERRKRGLCTVKQGRLLRSLGLRDDLDFNEARGLLEIIAAGRWRVPGWMSKRYGLREKKPKAA